MPLLSARTGPVGGERDGTLWCPLIPQISVHGQGGGRRGEEQGRGGEGEEDRKSRDHSNLIRRLTSRPPIFCSTLRKSRLKTFVVPSQIVRT